jgi:hypothetical protein
LKTMWLELRASPAGVRFRHFHREYSRRCTRWHKLLLVVAASLSFGCGLVFAFIPGPAVVFFAFTCAAVAVLSSAVARRFDRMELRVRRIIRRWRHRPSAG